jgi:hypothetical protein
MLGDEASFFYLEKFSARSCAEENATFGPPFNHVFMEQRLYLGGTEGLKVV